tara:strand:+ start:1346 stop:1537 length:192 start_codon:yes stop_codon:yes gene_type:complete
MFCKVRKTLKEYREWQLKMYNRWEDTLEVRLAGISAAKSKLEEQIKRDATDRLHNDIRDNGNS